MRRSAIAAFAAVLLLSCGGTPTAPDDECTNPVSVFASLAEYRERPEAEALFRGRLTKNCPPPTPNGRDHCYFLGDIPVYSGGPQTEAALAPFAGSDVSIRGKRVLILGPSEIWPATICRR